MDVRIVGRFVVQGTRRAACTLVGFSVVAIGLAGLVLPILPGWLLILAGFALLSREYAWAQTGLAFARRHAARGGSRLRSLALRRSRSPGERVIDVGTLQAEADEAARHAADRRRASNLG